MLTVRVLEDPAALAAHVAAWEDLAQHAAEPNPFYEPWMLLPALEAWGREARLQFVLVHAGPLLCGLFPLERRSRYRGLPFPHVRLWKYIHCFLGTPLVRRSHARETLHALLDWLARDRNGAAAIEWGEVAGDGPFFAALGDVLDDGGKQAFRSYKRSRAVLRRRADGEAYLREALPGTSRKEYRRLERRLADAGTVRYEAPEGEAAIDAFLRLEAAGWKGERGSALGSSEAGQRFFRRATQAAAARGRLMMLGLTVAGRPVAMKCNFLAGEGAFAFKIAYDESYARCSPGALLELENIRAFHRRPELAWMDGCAAPDHFMLNRLWLERRSLVDLISASGRAPGDFLVSSLPLLHWMRRSLRARAHPGGPAAQPA
jgi:CelD/BcsL family acetyltransferase involved in cellulose biosynthesis